MEQRDSVVVPQVNYYNCGDFVLIFGPLFSFKNEREGFPRPIRPLLLVQVRRRREGGPIGADGADGEGLVLDHYFFVYCSVSSVMLKLFITGKLGNEYWKGVSTLTSTSLYPPINKVGLRVFTGLLVRPFDRPFDRPFEEPDIVDELGILGCLHRCMPLELPLPSTGQMMQHFRINDVNGFLRRPLSSGDTQGVEVLPVSLFTTFHFENKTVHRSMRVPDSFYRFLDFLATDLTTDNLLLSVRCVDGKLVVEERKYLRQHLNLPPVLACALSLTTPLKYRTHSVFWPYEAQARKLRFGEKPPDKVVVQRPFPDTVMLGRFSITDTISIHITGLDSIQQSKVWNKYLQYYFRTLTYEKEENVKEFCDMLLEMPKKDKEDLDVKDDDLDVDKKRQRQDEPQPHTIDLIVSSIMKEDTERNVFERGLLYYEKQRVQNEKVPNAQRADELAKLSAVKDDGFVLELVRPQLSELREFDVTVGDEIFNISNGGKKQEMRLHVLASCDLTLLHTSGDSRLKIWFYVIERDGEPEPVAYPHYVSIETGDAEASQVTTCGTGLIDPSYLLETTALMQLAASGIYDYNYESWEAAALELSTISRMIVAQYTSMSPSPSPSPSMLLGNKRDDDGGGGAAKGGGSAFKLRSFIINKHNKTYRNISRNRHIINKHKKQSRNKHKKHTRRKSHRK